MYRNPYNRSYRATGILSVLSALMILAAMLPVLPAAASSASHPPLRSALHFPDPVTGRNTEFTTYLIPRWFLDSPPSPPPPETGTEMNLETNGVPPSPPWASGADVTPPPPPEVPGADVNIEPPEPPADPRYIPVLPPDPDRQDEQDEQSESDAEFPPEESGIRQMSGPLAPTADCTAESDLGIIWHTLEEGGPSFGEE
ncbi:MAG TPA: hypothetical protein ENF52_00935, partial [Chloroflexi bacterium]|nr:hypothetical protein [Chloroflexota bacterium]